MKIKLNKHAAFIDGGILSGLVFLAALVIVSAGTAVYQIIDKQVPASAPDGWYMQ